MKPSSQRPPSAEQRMVQRIYREVGHELRMLPRFSRFDNLAYKVEGGTVTLLGQVYHADLKSDAEHRVKRIEGVDKVVNQIEILPVSINDDRLRRQLSRAIFNDPRLTQYAIQPVPPIHIIVKNGHVSLEGVVRNQGDKNAAGIRANGVFGVFSVENNLVVESKGTR
ncbi:MAG: BON domain-containing protein [Acidobacteriia bacterium]|nr:BON domain-containing protein [Terriglobia bacterium]